MRRFPALLIAAAMAAAIYLSMPAMVRADGVAGVIVVTACGNQSLQPWSATSPTLGVLTVDQTGKLCDSATPALATTGGWTLHEDDALTNTAVAIKASGGQLGKLYCYNPNASVVYIQTYNVAAGSVTPGTTAHAQSYGIPATNAAGFSISPGDQYSTAISYAATTTPGGGTAPGTALTCNVSYN